MAGPQQHWTDEAAGLDTLEAQARRTLGGLRPALLPAGHVLFRPGEAVRGFVVMLSGRAEVYLSGPTPPRHVRSIHSAGSRQRPMTRTPLLARTSFLAGAGGSPRRRDRATPA